jgi:hypothetical protein
MTKFKEFYQRMIANNDKLFDDFIKLHRDYSINQDNLQERFNKEGAKVVAVIREWEGKLCSTSERAGYGSYTSNLSEKFWEEVRKNFPLIDYVGVIVKNKPSEDKNDFNIRKIKL